MVLAVALLLIFAVSVPVFADWSLEGEIINADTFETIRTFGLTSSANSESNAKEDIRRRLGFPETSDTRTVGNVTQRIVWTKSMKL
jgi:hypothetical protein